MGLLTFQEEGHQYTHNNNPIPSVTQIISEMGLLGDYVPDPWYLERGKLVHLCCEYLDKNCLDWDSVDNEIKPRVEAYQKFKQDYKFEPRMIEQPVHSHGLNVACTPDREGDIKGIASVIEIKNGGRQKWHRLQLSIQDICIHDELNECGSFKYRYRYSLELKADGTYKLHRYKEDDADRKAAISLVTLYHWLKEGKREKK